MTLTLGREVSEAIVRVKERAANLDVLWNVAASLLATNGINDDFYESREQMASTTS